MEDLEQDVVRVPAAEDFDDETFIKHLELRHGESLSHKFVAEPDRVRRGLPRRMAEGNRKIWETYHRKVHELYDGRANGPWRHIHKEPK